MRSRDPGLIRGLIVGAIREALQQSGIRPTSTRSEAMLTAFQTQKPLIQQPLGNLKTLTNPLLIARSLIILPPLQ